MKNRIYIVGAHSRGRTAGIYLKELYPNLEVEAYLYDNEEKNPADVNGVPVVRLDRTEDLDTSCPVILGTKGIYHQNLSEKLKKLGFTAIYPITPELDLKLRNGFLEKYFVRTGREFVKIDHMLGISRRFVLQKKTSAVIYMTRSVCDKPLQKVYPLASYEVEIQAGAALTKQRFSETGVTDDIGIHISDRNKQFCELTALYWIWKHTAAEIVGLVHYRRHFILPEDWVDRMDANKIDIILPVPLYVAPDVARNYKSRHDATDWDYMMECLREKDMGTWEEAEAFFRNNLYSPCNMFIMRRAVLDELCRWLFPLLFQVAEHGGEKEDSYRNRYPGFLSERLISFFAENNRGKYKIVYADKNFLV